MGFIDISPLKNNKKTLFSCTRRTSCTLLGFQGDAAQRAGRLRRAAEDRQRRGRHKGPRRPWNWWRVGAREAQ